MSILFVLIPLGLALTGVAVWAFFWAADHGQFDDLETPAASILFEEEHAKGSARAKGPGTGKG